MKRQELSHPESNNLPVLDWDLAATLHWIVHRAVAPVASISEPSESVTEGVRPVLAMEYQRALEELNYQVRAGKLLARGRPSASTAMPTEHRPRESIPAHIVDELRQIDFWGWIKITDDAPDVDILRDPGPFFYDLVFRPTEVQSLWKAGITGRKRLRQSDLVKWLEWYLPQHTDLDTHPTAAEQRQSVIAFFPDHAEPSQKLMQQFRAHHAPAHWSGKGRRPKSG